MNEKIKELAQQADMEIDYFGYGYCTDGGNPDVEKFAELIVKECIGFFENINDREDAVAMLKVHFGVEE